MLFSSKPKPRPILILEVQSALVRGSLVVREGAGSAQVLFSEASEVPYRPHASTAHHIKSVTRSAQEICHRALARLWTIADKRPDLDISERIAEVHFVLSSPWIVSQAKAISIEHDKDTTMSMDSVKSVLAEERKKISMEEKMDAVTIEEKIFNIKLNGYPVSDWEGRSARTLEMSYAISVGSRAFVDRLHDISEHAAQCKNVAFHSSLLLNYVYLSDLDARHSSFALINVHGELTDVAVVKNGSCAFFGSFPVGNDTIIRRIARDLSLDRKSADSLLSLYLGDHLDTGNDPRSAAEVAQQGAAWASELSRICSADSACELPQAMYVTAASHEPLYISNLSLIAPKAHASSFPADPVTAYASAIHSL